MPSCRIIGDYYRAAQCVRHRTTRTVAPASSVTPGRSRRGRARRHLTSSRAAEHASAEPPGEWRAAKPVYEQCRQPSITIVPILALVDVQRGEPRAGLSTQLIARNVSGWCCIFEPRNYRRACFVAIFRLLSSQAQWVVYAEHPPGTC